jgi:hypothetical protein
MTTGRPEPSTAPVGLIPWPVAAAIGIGTALAQRDKR